jgi:omega-amidase
MKNASFDLGLLPCEQIWENPDKNLERLTYLLASDMPCDLWLIPEMFTTGFSMNPRGLALNETPDALERLVSIAAKQNTYLAGSFIWKDKNQYFNRFLLIGSNGIEGSYDKKNLFSLGGEHSAYCAGTQTTLWNVKGVLIKPFVCYDLRFPEWCRNNECADLMLFSANWPQSRDHHWRTLLIARAIENQAFVAGVNRLGTDGNWIKYSGLSLVVDANGSVLAEPKEQEGGFITRLNIDELRLFREKFPFLKDRNQSLNP